MDECTSWCKTGMPNVTRTLHNIHQRAWRKLQRKAMGFKIKNQHIPALFFADDIVRIANTEEENKDLIKEVMEFTKKWKLEISEEKSQVLHIGRNKRSEGHTWTIENDNDKIQLANTELYKYLGVYINRERNPFKTQIDEMRKKGKNKLNAMKIIAKHSINKVWTVDALWKGEIIPALLYACEVIPFNKTAKTNLESLQSEVGRWILAGNNGMPLAGIRGEMGWKRLDGEIMRRKLNYYGKIAYMEDSRWVKAIWVEMRKEEQPSKWYTEIKEAAHELNISLDEWKFLKNHRQWKKYVNKKVDTWEQMKWKMEVMSKPSLELYPKRVLSTREDYIDDTIESKNLTRWRLNNIRWNIETESGKACRACGSGTGSIIHVLTECDKTSKLHNKQIKEETEEDKHTSTRNLLTDRSVENMQYLKELYDLWRGSEQQPSPPVNGGGT